MTPISPFPIPRNAWTATYTRASGPGGQNVNKVSSKAELRVDLEVLGLGEEALARVRGKLAARLDAEGRLLIKSQKTRDQEKNLEDALERAGALIAAALVVPRKRRPTRVPFGAKVNRLDSKRRRGERKESRRRPPE